MQARWLDTNHTTEVSMAKEKAVLTGHQKMFADAQAKYGACKGSAKDDKGVLIYTFQKKGSDPVKVTTTAIFN